MAKIETMKFRLSTDEKTAFEQCADLAGIALSAWVRERLRSAAIRELESAGQAVPFLRPIPLRSNDV